MAQLLSPETFEFFAKYLLAGYVIIIVRSRFVLGLRPNPAGLIVEAVVLSLLNQLVFALTYWGAGLFGQFSTEARISLFLEVLVQPTLIGLLLGWNLSRGWNRAFLRRLSMPVIHPVQRAYDFAFGKDRAATLVMVTYEDGTVIRGYFGERSLAASDPNRSDLFLERLYSEDDNGQWTEMEPGRAGWINLNGVRSVEFLDPTGD